MIDPQDEWCDDCHGYTHTSDCPAFTRATAAAPLDTLKRYRFGEFDGPWLLEKDVLEALTTPTQPETPLFADRCLERGANGLYCDEEKGHMQLPIREGQQFASRHNFALSLTAAPEPPDPAAEKVAKEIVREFYHDWGVTEEQLAQRITAALQARDERAARIAESYIGGVDCNFLSGTPDRERNGLMKEVAEKIREEHPDGK